MFKKQFHASDSLNPMQLGKCRSPPAEDYIGLLSEVWAKECDSGTPGTAKLGKMRY